MNTEMLNIIVIIFTAFLTVVYFLLAGLHSFLYSMSRRYSQYIDEYIYDIEFHFATIWVGGLLAFVVLNTIAIMGGTIPIIITLGVIISLIILFFVVYLVACFISNKLDKK